MKQNLFMPATVKFIYCLLLLVMPTVSLLAQLDDPGGGIGGGDPDAPIDGGLSVLVAAGVGYGVKQLQKQKQKK
jgi:hypothetical protein